MGQEVVAEKGTVWTVRQTQIFWLAEGCGCLAEGRGRFTFYLRPIRFLHGLCGFLTFHSFPAFPQDSCSGGIFA